MRQSEWITDDPKIIGAIIGQPEDKEDKLPVLVPQVNKLYKLRLLENPRKIEGTEGYAVKVKNQANGKQYLLFLQKVLSSKFKEVKAKKGDFLGVINKGKNMQTGYDYSVSIWDKKLNRYLRRGLSKRLGLGAKESLEHADYVPEAAEADVD